MKYVVFVLLPFCLLVATGCGGSAGISSNSAAASATSQHPLAATFFGSTTALNMASRPWPDVPMPVFRGFDSSWWRLEPTKGNWDFKMLDDDVRITQENGGQMQLVFSTTPTWASARPTESSPQSWLPLGVRAEPANVQDWVNYVQTVATRYKGIVHSYECWNEPDQSNSYTGDVSHLVEMCKAAYTAVKAIDPTITFTSPSFCSYSTNPFIKRYIENGGVDTFDVLSFHYYPNQSNPESISTIVQKVRSILTQNGIPNTPLWLTEVGYYMESGPNAKYRATSFPASANVLGDRLSQEYVARTFLVGQLQGLDRVQWFSWGNAPMTLSDDNGYTDKPATTAYRAIVEWLLGSTITSSTRDDNGTWTVALKLSSGAAAHILWNDQESSVSVAIQSTWNATSATDVAGTSYSLSKGTITVTGMPVLVQ
jgi:hypothetical protein